MATITVSGYRFRAGSPVSLYLRDTDCAGGWTRGHCTGGNCNAHFDLRAAGEPVQTVLADERGWARFTDIEPNICFWVSGSDDPAHAIPVDSTPGGAGGWT